MGIIDSPAIFWQTTFMNIFRKWFPKKRNVQKKAAIHSGDDPGYLACPVVASELKRGKFDSYSEDEPADQTAVGEATEDLDKEKP